MWHEGNVYHAFSGMKVVVIADVTGLAFLVLGQFVKDVVDVVGYMLEVTLLALGLN